LKEKRHDSITYSELISIYGTPGYEVFKDLAYQEGVMTSKDAKAQQARTIYIMIGTLAPKNYTEATSFPL
jgi:hypothetical protein